MVARWVWDSEATSSSLVVPMGCDGLVSVPVFVCGCVCVCVCQLGVAVAID